jgi:hypothetical protein
MQDQLIIKEYKFIKSDDYDYDEKVIDMRINRKETQKINEVLNIIEEFFGIQFCNRDYIPNKKKM